MSKLLKYFEKKKVEAKFKMAGPGRSLTEEPKATTSGVPQRQIPRVEQSTDSQKAGAAALARFEQHKIPDVVKQRSQAKIQAQAKKELAEEQSRLEALAKVDPVSVNEHGSSDPLSVNGVYFKCPLIGPEVLSSEEIQLKIKEFLYNQLEEERGFGSCLIIHTCNKNKEKVSVCVETLCKYLQNIIDNPTEEKYFKIKLSNKVFEQKVSHIEGVQDFLLACGFELKTVVNENQEEKFWVLPPEKLDVENLNLMIDALSTAEPVVEELDRGTRVLIPSSCNVRVNLPPEFFVMTSSEIHSELDRKAEEVEKHKMLRTRAMREENHGTFRKYKYTLLRIRLPDDYMLQGTFAVHEKFSAVKSFINENLNATVTNYKLLLGSYLFCSEDDSKSLLDLKLVPSVVLTLSPSQELREVLGKNQQSYLKTELMLLKQEL